MIGSRLGKWIIDKELGRGGMGCVYLAHEEISGDQAALKVLAPELAKEPGFLHRFQREIEVLSQLSHPNIVRFFEPGLEEGYYFYAMEYVDGESFEQLLIDRIRLPWKEVLDAALQICPALKHAHDRGIIHRDIKPPNLLRTPAGVVKLTDFGIAKVFASQQLTKTGGVVGTAEYLSPEQAAGKQATKRSDLYSLGVVLYTLLTSKTPFEGRSTADILHKHLYAQFDRPMKRVPEIPHELDEVVCQLLEKDPARRPADGLVLQRQLDSIRRKLERKAQHTILRDPEEGTVTDNPLAEAPAAGGPGPATIMSQLMREELRQEKLGSPFHRWINRPWVLLPLFLLCVGLIVYRFWPQAGEAPEILFEKGSLLMASEDPADWDKAWEEDLAPLNRLYPDHSYQQQVEEFRQQIDDHNVLRRALSSVKFHGPTSEAERFYQRGLRLCQEGDTEAARQVWQGVVDAFGTVQSEKRWVQSAQRAIQELKRRLPPDQKRSEAIREAWQQAKTKDARSSLEALYRDDIWARQEINKLKQERSSNGAKNASGGP